MAEAICSIDEDNKHTEQLKIFIVQTKESQRSLILDSEMEEAVGLSFVSTAKVGIDHFSEFKI